MIRVINGGIVYLDELKNSVENDATEKVTSRKCKGQLSSKTNSCSSYKGANRTTEMAQEDHNSCWDNLPSVILEKIFSYLPHKCRLRASQVCRNWRYALFHPSFWKKITFTLGNEDILWAHFLAESYGLSVHEATIRCDTLHPSAEDISAILERLSYNKQLRKLFLESTRSHFFKHAENEYTHSGHVTPLIKPIIRIIETADKLEVLSLGCIEELAVNARELLQPLHMKQAEHLTTLCLASVRLFPDSVPINFGCGYENFFKSFSNLSVLTLDYENVNDSLLEALDNRVMKRLVIHLHGWNDDYRGTSDSAWQQFVRKNRNCELRLNILRSRVGITRLHSDIFRPSMPLTHLKVLFCQNVNNRALFKLSTWYNRTFKSLIWIDSVDTQGSIPPMCDPTDNEQDSTDPLVFIAWRCTKLVEIVFIGYKYDQENLIAIARLRGCTLKSLVFAQRDIASYDKSWRKAESIRHEIQEIIDPRWEQVSDADLPAALKDPRKGNRRDVIMPLVLRDQK